MYCFIYNVFIVHNTQNINKYEYILQTEHSSEPQDIKLWFTIF